MSTRNVPENQHIEGESDPTIPRPLLLVSTQPEKALAQESIAQAICPHCRTPYRVGELACLTCGIVFNTRGKTNLVFGFPQQQSEVQPCGDAHVEPDKTCYLEINGLQLELPNQNVIVIGRAGALTDPVKPDITLNAYGAAELGVSRQHARITRHGNIFYIADMGSSNGTFLNGRLLLRNHNRLLRSGDELQLGQMKLHIRF